jgi:hypothetical protein
MYRYMARRGGMESWFLFPVIRCPEIPKSQLNMIEQGYIKADPRCLNTQHSRRKGLAEGCAQRSDVLDFRPRATGFGVARKSQSHHAEHNRSQNLLPLSNEIKAKRG